MTIVPLSHIVYVPVTSMKLFNLLTRLNERRGTMYKTPSIVFVEFQCDILIFHQVQDILFIQEKFFLVLQLLKAEVFNSHFHAYEVQRMILIYLCEVDSLVDHHSLWIYQNYNPHLLEKCFIHLKYFALSSSD